MKTLVISDTHLTHKFDRAKFGFLAGIINDSDRVVLNGDFWDGYTCKFSDFLRSKWKKLFPLLKASKTVYVLGNHDNVNLTDERASRFSVKVCEDFYEFEDAEVNFVAEHGHQYVHYLDYKLPFLTKFPFANQAHQRFSKWLLLRKGLDVYKDDIENNKLMAEQGHLRHDDKAFLLMGHTHLAELDGLNKYANSGCVLYGYAQYLTIENGQVDVHYARY